jgi:hypothetical protein
MARASNHRVSGTTLLDGDTMGRRAANGVTARRLGCWHGVAVDALGQQCGLDARTLPSALDAAACGSPGARADTLRRQPTQLGHRLPVIVGVAVLNRVPMVEPALRAREPGGLGPEGTSVSYLGPMAVPDCGHPCTLCSREGAMSVISSDGRHEPRNTATRLACASTTGMLFTEGASTLKQGAR